MLKLFKYLKESIIPVLIIIVLLFLQANADLALPEYTSKIVNVGIQQNGINESIPKAVKEETFEKIKLLVNNEDLNIILNNYQLIKFNELTNKEKTKYLEKYSNIDKINIYEKISNNDLNNILEKPLLIIGLFEIDNEQTNIIKNNLIKEISSQDIDIFDYLKSLNQDQRTIIINKIYENFSNMPESIITQSAISIIKLEYQGIGININNIQTNYIIKTGAIMLIIALISMIIAIIVGLLGSKVSSKMAKTLRSKLFEKVLSFSNTEYKQFGAASLITRSTNDIEQVRMTTVMMLRIVIYAPILGIGGVIKVLNTNNSMSWIIALAIAIILIVVMALFVIVMPKFKIIQNLIDKLNLVSKEFLNGVPVIRAFNTEKHEEKRFDKANVNLTKTSLFVNRVMSLMFPLMNLIMNGVVVIIVWSGAHSIEKGSMQVGDMMAFIQYTMQIIMAFLMITIASIMIPRASVSANRIEEVLKTKNVIIDPIKPKKFNKKKKGFVEFKNVSFKYPDADENVITDINFIAKPGETTAFIGSTGSGKSTIVNLIPRFFDVTSGSILVDGVDIKEVNQKDLRRKIGYIPQKGILFSGTIESNIKYGNPKLNDNKVKEAASTAQALDFIMEKEKKYNSEIAQGGTNVSGGQKQRLSIARAIAVNPDIYIFDDSFSALDFKTDIKLRKELSKITKTATVLIVAQRINTIMNADQIIVLENGKIVGVGKHNELLNNCDIYKEIASSQLSKEELDHE